MGLLVVWGNLGLVLLPFLCAFTVAALLAIPLQRAAERSGLPRARERCIGCVGEAGLLARGRCEEPCAVNEGATLPLTVFVATATLGLFAFIDPGDFSGFVLPLGLDGPGVDALVLAGLVGANLGSALMLAAFFLQDLQAHRELFLRGSVLVALAGIVLTGIPAGAADRWIAIGPPLALGAILLGVGIEWRARHSRPTLGWRSVGFATAPIFLVVIFALIRLGQILALGAG